MREIKFRAWDGEKMHTAASHWFVEFDGDIWENVGAAYGPDELEDRSEVKVMQYTGLRDANGMEIYEGDILRCMNRDGENHVIGFEHGCFTARLIGIRPDSSSVEAKWRASFGIGEVIGNIYENAELIEGAN